MSTKWIGIYSGFFVLMLALALVVSGVFQQGILPRIWGLWAGGGTRGEVAEAGARELGPGKEGQGIKAKAAEPAPAREQTAIPSAGLATPGSQTSGSGDSDEARQSREAGPGPPPAAGESGRVSAGLVPTEGGPALTEESQSGRMSGGLIPGPVPTREGPAERVEQVKRLARVYEGMRAKEAASVIEKLERPLAARVLSEIKDRQAAKILGAMNPAAAADLTRLLGQPTSGETR